MSKEIVRHHGVLVLQCRFVVIVIRCDDFSVFGWKFDTILHLRSLLYILHMSESESLGKSVNLCCSFIGLTLGLGTRRGTSGSLSCVESLLLP